MEGRKERVSQVTLNALSFAQEKKRRLQRRCVCCAHTHTRAPLPQACVCVCAFSRAYAHIKGLKWKQSWGSGRHFKEARPEGWGSKRKKDKREKGQRAAGARLGSRSQSTRTRGIIKGGEVDDAASSRDERKAGGGVRGREAGKEERKEKGPRGGLGEGRIKGKDKKKGGGEAGSAATVAPPSRRLQ